MSTNSQPIIFSGIDWGSESHQVCIVNAAGTVLGEKLFPHSGEGLHQLRDWIFDGANCTADQIAVAIEVPHGPVVDCFMEHGFQVFAINPKQLDRFRDRFSPAGAKDDRRGARVLADAVRTDPVRRLDPVNAFSCANGLAWPMS
ncbi:MAG: transposase [Bacteroidetes bacterium]|nr:transposase [Bacteroidota bacterium]